MREVDAEDHSDLEQQDRKVGVVVGLGQLGVLVDQGGDLLELLLG